MRIMLMLLLALIPSLLMGQAVDTTGVGPSAPVVSWTKAASYVITLALGLLAPVFMRQLESLSSWLQGQSPITKRAVVSAIPGVVSIICAILAQHAPWFPWDPEPANALIATAIAYGVHSGDKAKDASIVAGEAKQIAEQTREMKSPA